MQDLVDFTKQKVANLETKIENAKKDIDKVKGEKRDEENKLK